MPTLAGGAAARVAQPAAAPAGVFLSGTEAYGFRIFLTPAEARRLRRRTIAAALRRGGRTRGVDTEAARIVSTLRAEQLQAQLAETEQKIAISRQVYNDAVLTYDNALETVPTNIVAGVFNFEPREYFEVEEPAVREAPRVEF